MRKKIYIFLPFVNLFGNIFHNIFDLAIKNSAEIVDLHSAYAIPFLHTINGRTTDIVLIDKRIGRNSALFQGFPKRSVTYQLLNHPNIS